MSGNGVARVGTKTMPNRDQPELLEIRDCVIDQLVVEIEDLNYPNLVSGYQPCMTFDNT